MHLRAVGRRDLPNALLNTVHLGVVETTIHQNDDCMRPVKPDSASRV